MNASAKILYASLFSFALGIAAETFLRFGIWGGAFLISLGIIAGLFARAGKRNALALCAISLTAFGIGMARMSLADTREYILDDFVGERITIEGVISDEPDARENSTLLTLGIPGGKILIIADRLAPFQYGDRVRAEGKLVLPENFTIDSGREFDYISYLAKDNVHYEMPFPEITLVAHGEANPAKERLFSAKRAFLNSINRMMPEPGAGLLGGILLGAKHALPKDLLEDFRTVGLVHIVVLSGYNITLITDFAMRLLAFLPRLYGLFAGGIFTLLFIIMTGANAATVRAGMMAVIVLFARYSGREAASVRLLFFVASLMLLWNPHALLDDPSFQLSVAATFGLLMFSSKISRRIGGEGKLFRTVASDTIATQIAVLPLLLSMTGRVSLYALPSNLLVIPVVPIAMLFGFAAGLLGFISQALALPFAAIAHILLSYIFLIAQFFAGLPFA